MRFGSLFSGVGGFDEGLERAGHECAFQVERDPFCLRVLAERWPDVRRWDDVRRVGTGLVGSAVDDTTGRGGESSFAAQHIDLLVGGWPCQDLSVAGKRAGLVGARSGLFWELVRIAGALRPRWLLLENVPGLLSSCSCRGCAVLARFLRRHRSRGCLGCPGCLAAEERRTAHHGSDLAVVCAALANLGYCVGYRILDSQFFGVAQRRHRVFFVGGPTEAGVAEVLALTEGGGGHPAASGQAGANIARCLATGTNGARYDGDTEDFVIAPEIAAAINPGHEGKHSYAGDGGTINLVVAQCHGSNVGPMGALRGGNGNETGGVPFVVDTMQVTSRANRSNPKPGDPCHPLAESAHAPLLVGALRHMGGGGPDDNEAQAGHLVHTLSAEGHDASEDGTGRGTPIIPIQYAEQWGRDKRQNGVGIGEEAAPSFTLDASYPHGISGGSMVRRLTPVECERLQNFPDGWTCLCQPLAAYAADPDAAALACTCPDNPRYRALGNAVTVSVIEYLGRRLARMSPPAARR